MEHRVTSLEVFVVDLGRSAQFYRDIVGLDLGEADQHEGNEQLHHDAAWGDLSTPDYMLLHLTQGTASRVTTGAVIGINVVDLDDVHRRAVEAGVIVVAPPHAGPWGHSAKYEDPDGNVVSLTEPDA